MPDFARQRRELSAIDSAHAVERACKKGSRSISDHMFAGDGNLAAVACGRGGGRRNRHGHRGDEQRGDCGCHRRAGRFRRRHRNHRR